MFISNAQYNATPPTLADKQFGSLQLDVNGNLMTAGGGGGAGDASAANQTTQIARLDSILAKIIAAPATEAKQDTQITAEQAILAKLTIGASTLTKAEDAVHASGDAGIMSLAVRADTAAATGANGDYVPLLTDATGRLHIVDANTTSMLAAFKAEDAVHASGDLGLPALVVRKDTAVALGADGDYTLLQTDSTGRLHVGAAPAATETKITAATMPTGGVGFVGWLSAMQYGIGLASDAPYSDATGAAVGTINAILKGIYVESQDSTPSAFEIYEDGVALEALAAGQAARGGSTPTTESTEGILELTAPYPKGSTPVIAGSGNVANAAATSTLAATASVTTYLTGFQVTGAGATTGLPVIVTITGLLGGTRSFIYCFATGALVANSPLIVNFSRPLPASAVNTAIVVSCPAGGTGNTHNTSTAYGFYL